ncbi:uncharacterized protein BDR25DRAFT_195738, partial [Lindgomyces ingoldianus]
RNHVLKDLKPYICTYAQCSHALHMYSSRHHWLEHERLAHRRTWQCFEHANATFNSSSKLREHLQSQHQGAITEKQIDTLIEVGESGVKDTRKRCPICLAEDQLPNGLSMTNHVSYHMEQFAVFSIRGVIDN